MKGKRMIRKADCGHFEYLDVIVTQFHKTNCRDCAQKNNRMLSNLVRSAMKGAK